MFEQFSPKLDDVCSRAILIRSKGQTSRSQQTIAWKPCEHHISTLLKALKSEDAEELKLVEFCRVLFNSFLLLVTFGSIHISCSAHVMCRVYCIVTGSCRPFKRSAEFTYVYETGQWVICISCISTVVVLFQVYTGCVSKNVWWRKLQCLSSNLIFLYEILHNYLQC